MRRISFAVAYKILVIGKARSKTQSSDKGMLSNLLFPHCTVCDFDLLISGNINFRHVVYLVSGNGYRHRKN